MPVPKGSRILHQSSFSTLVKNSLEEDIEKKRLIRSIDIQNNRLNDRLNIQTERINSIQSVICWLELCLEKLFNFNAKTGIQANFTKNNSLRMFRPPH